MPIYSYYCKRCDLDQDIVKPMDLSSMKEKCYSCGATLTRLYKSNFKLCDSFYDSTKDIEDGLAGKPYKGHYFKEDEDCNMG